MEEEKVLVEEVVEATEEAVEEKSFDEMSIEELQEKEKQILNKTRSLRKEENKLLSEKSQIQEKIDSCRNQIDQIYKETDEIRIIINLKGKEEKINKFKKGTYWTNALIPTIGKNKLFKVLSCRKYHEKDIVCKMSIIDLFDKTIEVKEMYSDLDVFGFHLSDLLDLKEAPKEFIEGTLKKAQKLFKM